MYAPPPGPPGLPPLAAIQAEIARRMALQNLMNAQQGHQRGGSMAAPGPVGPFPTAPPPVHPLQVALNNYYGRLIR